MPRVSRRRTAGGADHTANAAAAASGPPIVLDEAGDAAVLGVLAKCEVPPSLFLNPALGFKVVWALKHLAARARERVRAAKQKKGHKRMKSPKVRAEAGVTLLRSRLKFLGLRMKVIEGDGHCQFRACSDQLYGTQEHHASVRSAAVEYMREHAAEFSCFCVEEGAFESYLKEMLHGKRGKPIWGDELTLRAICNALGCTIHVLTSQSGGSATSWYLKYVPETPRSDKQVFLAYISPVHYNAFELGSAGGGGGAAAAAARAKAPTKKVAAAAGPAKKAAAAPNKRRASARGRAAPAKRAKRL
jgi:hypothetical protein